MSDFLKPSTETRHPISRRGFATGLTIGLGSLATGRVNIAEALAQCVGPERFCPPDGIARQAFADVFRIVRNNGEHWAISDAAVRAYLLEPIGTTDHPELDRQNPVLGSDGSIVGFRNIKPGHEEVRKVEKSYLFVAPQPGDSRFNGRLINSETGEDFIRVTRRGDELKDMALGKLRGSLGCEAGCTLNCVETFVWERQISASNPVAFRNSAGQVERFQGVAWSWELSEPNPSRQPMVSYSDITEAQLRNLINKGEVAKGLQFRIDDLKHQMGK